MGQSQDKFHVPRPRTKKVVIKGLKKPVYGLYDQKTKITVPLSNMEVEIVVVENIARIEMKQTFENTTSNPMEVVYNFALPELGTISEFDVIIDDKTIKSIVMEKEEAFGAYDDAISAGYGAYLMESKERSTDFTLRIGNLPQGKRATTRIAYVQPLVSFDDGFYLILSYKNFPAVDMDLSIKGRISSLDELKAIECKTHQLTTDVGKRTFSYKNHQKQQLAEDIHIMITTESNGKSAALVERHPVLQNSFGVLASIYPSFEDVNCSIHHEVVFMLDRSGSMYGEKLDSAVKALDTCLHSLPMGCMFNIVGFGDRVESMWSSSKLYGEDTLKYACEQIYTYDATLGGCDWVKCLDQIYAKSQRQTHALSIFIITDGEAENPKDIFRYLEPRAENWRLYTIGIGQQVDEYLLQGAARFGHGQCALLNDPTSLTATLVKMIKHAIQPVLTNVTVDWQLPAEIVELRQTPTTVSRLLVGNRLNLYAIFESALPELSAENFEENVENMPKLNSKMLADAKLVLTGSNSDGKVLTFEVSLADNKSKKANVLHPYVASVLRDLQTSDEDIIDTCIKYQIGSTKTSFVAIEERDESVQGEMVKVEVANNSVEPEPEPIVIPDYWYRGCGRRYYHYRLHGCPPHSLIKRHLPRFCSRDPFAKTYVNDTKLAQRKETVESQYWDDSEEENEKEDAKNQIPLAQPAERLQSSSLQVMAPPPPPMGMAAPAPVSHDHAVVSRERKISAVLKKKGGFAPPSFSSSAESPKKSKDRSRSPRKSAKPSRKEEEVSDDLLFNAQFDEVFVKEQNESMVAPQFGATHFASHSTSNLAKLETPVAPQPSRDQLTKGKSKAKIDKNAVVTPVVNLQFRVQQIIHAQRADGSWKQEDVAKFLNIANDVMTTQSAKMGLDMAIYLTMLMVTALEYLYNAYADTLVMILEKANSFLVQAKATISKDHTKAFKKLLDDNKQ